MALVYPVSSLAAHPPRLSPAYKNTVKRSPTKPLIPMRHTLSELTGPVYGHETVREHDHDLTIQGKGEPLGERIIAHVLDEDGRGVANTLVELCACTHRNGIRQGQVSAVKVEFVLSASCRIVLA